MAELNPKQQRFVAEYLKDSNGTQAAIRAGYSEATAGSQAHDLLKKPEIKQAIAESLEEVGISALNVLRELKRIALADVSEAFDSEGRLKKLSEMSLEVRRAIASVEVDQLFDGHGEGRYHAGDTMKVKFWDKPKSLELLGKYLKLFTEKHEHTGAEGGAIVFEFPPIPGGDS